jgi:hypothetical protein
MNSGVQGKNNEYHNKYIDIWPYWQIVVFALYSRITIFIVQNVVEL